jgi:hypothetical protein
MHRPSAFLLVILTGTLAFGQTSSNQTLVPKNLPVNTFTQGQTLASTNQISDTFGCPIGFSASRQASPQIMSASDAKQPGPTMGLHLMLNRRDQPAIESIEVTVEGLSPRPGILLVNAPAKDTVISKVFELQRKADSQSLNDADVWMHQVGSLRWADLMAITYADGSTWHATENFKCRAVPSNFILIGSR